MSKEKKAGKKDEEAQVEKVHALYEESPDTASVPESGEPEAPEEKKAPMPPGDPKLDTAFPAQRFVSLNQLHGLMVELVGLKIEESENRVRQSQREIDQAQKDLKQAQRDNREAKASAQEAADRILREMNLHPTCVINVENKMILPPQGQDFIKGRDE